MASSRLSSDAEDQEHDSFCLGSLPGIGGGEVLCESIDTKPASKLNAASFQMIEKLLNIFIAYEDDPNVLVIMKGKGRAFCAGGDDVAAVARVCTEGQWRVGAEFFWKEYNLNYIISTYKKPQVSFLNGIVRGGGAGLSIHSRFRVATENSVFAMPEAALGLFPDRLPLLEEAFTKVDVVDPAVVSAIIDRFSEQIPLKEKSACHRKRLNFTAPGIVLDRFSSLQAVEQCFWASGAPRSVSKA